MTVTIEDFYAYAEALNVDVNQGFDNLALLYASAFMRGEISYEDADDILNTIWWFMCRSKAEGFANLAYSIYEAFDAGEFSRKEGEDPVQTYTIPMLQEIFNALDFTHGSQ